MSTYASVTSQNIVINNSVNNKYEQNESVEERERNDNDEASSVFVECPYEFYYSEDDYEFEYNEKNRRKSVDKTKINGKRSWSNRDRHTVNREVVMSHCEKQDSILLKKRRNNKKNQKNGSM